VILEHDGVSASEDEDSNPKDGEIEVRNVELHS
jgi:hypothetical protein